MKGFDFDFLTITVTDVVDICSLPSSFTILYNLIKNTLAVNLLLGYVYYIDLYGS